MELTLLKCDVCSGVIVAREYWDGVKWQDEMVCLMCGRGVTV